MCTGINGLSSENLTVEIYVIYILAAVFPIKIRYRQHFHLISPPERVGMNDMRYFINIFNDIQLPNIRDIYNNKSVF